MQELPYDIVFQIVHELKRLEGPPERWRRPDLQPMKFAPYATLSRAWNVAIEQEIFRDLVVYSDDIPEDLRGPITTTRFKQMMSRDAARRRAIPRNIIYFASSQSRLDSEEAHTEEGRNSNDRRFSASVRQLWEMLEDWPPVPDHAYLRLDLRLASTTLKLRLKTKGGNGKATRERRKDKMYLNLSGGPLPRLRCISHFDLAEEMRLWPPALLNVLRSFEGIRDAYLNLQDASVTEGRFWIEHREELGSNIAALPNTITSLDVNFNYISRGYSNFPSYPSLTLDRLSISLRDVSTRLRCLTLSNIRITPALFWPGIDEPATTQLPYWPHLEMLLLSFAPLDPCGNWYVEASGEYDADLIHHVPALFDPSDYIFDSPQKKHISRLVAAAGHAVRRMPRLKWMDIVMIANAEKVNMNEDPDEVELHLCITEDVKATQDREGRALTLIWECKPPVPWTTESISAWGMEENAELLSVDEDDYFPKIKLRAPLVL